MGRSQGLFLPPIHIFLFMLYPGSFKALKNQPLGKTKFAQEIAPQNQGISNKRLLRMNAKLDSGSALALSLELKKDEVQLQREMLQ